MNLHHYDPHAHTANKYPPHISVKIALDPIFGAISAVCLLTQTYLSIVCKCGMVNSSNSRIYFPVQCFWTFAIIQITVLHINIAQRMGSYQTSMYLTKAMNVQIRLRLSQPRAGEHNFDRDLI